MPAPERHFIALPLFGSGRDAISSPQQDYYRSRAAEERAAAGDDAADPDLAALHERMARLFESLANELDRPPHPIAPGW